MKKYTASLALLVAITLTFTFGSFAQAAVCPPKPGATELTFSRIMMNFGRMTMKADSLTREMKDSGTSKEIPAAAIEDLAVAAACADVAINAATAASEEHAAGKEISAPVAVLLPHGVSQCPGDTKTKFLAVYGQMMVDFKVLLELYSQNITAADYIEGFATSQKVKNFADHAHEHLNTSTFCEKALGLSSSR